MNSFAAAVEAARRGFDSPRARTRARADSAKGMPPALVLRFAIYTAIPLALAAAAIVWFLQYNATERAREAVGFRARSVAYTILRDRLRPSDFAAPVTGPRLEALDEIFARLVLVEGASTVRVKLWSRDGRVTYSNVHRLIGTREAGNTGVVRALRGETELEVTHLEPTAAEPQKVLEAYVPVRLTDGVRPSGALEIYEDYGPVSREIRSTVLPVATALGLALLAVYALLFPILRRVTRAIELRNRQLAEQAEDLREQTVAVELLQLAAMAANEATTVEGALQVCLDAICEHTGWPVGHAYIAEKESGELGSSGVWHIDDPTLFEAFRVATETTRMSAGTGLPGRVLAERRPVWLTDSGAETETSFPREVQAREAGFKAAFGFPVLVGSEVAGVLEFFSTELHEPDEPLLNLMSHIGAQLGRVIERSRAEEALRASEESFRAIFEKAAIGIAIVGPDGRLLTANAALQQMLGYTDEPLRDVTLADLTHPEDIGATTEASLGLAAGTLTRYLDERRFVTKDGEVVWGHVAGSAVPGADGRAAFEIVMVQDVSERKQLEDQLVQSQKMEAIGRLAGGIAHDFNNLLLVITGYGETVLSAMDAHDPLRYEIGQMTHAAERAASLTGQLLAFSRKQMLQPRQVDLNAVVAETEAMLRRLIDEDIELETHPDPQLAVVRADPGQISQVLLNLAVNGRDAMPDGGKLTIETANVTLERPAVHEHFSIEAGCYATVAVSDTGHGIDAELQTRVFEPFFTTKEQGRGTGLGLATVYGIIKQSGGYITVDSARERGTTFTVYLPLDHGAANALQPAAPAAAAPARDARTGGKSVLVVEDEPAVRGLVRSLLARDGYTVLEAASPDEALAICERDSATIDLVVTDVVMPGMAGPELASRLVERRPGLKVIYMSGYTDDALDRRGVPEAGAAFLQKPFTRDTLARAIREVLDAT